MVLGPLSKIMNPSFEEQLQVVVCQEGEEGNF